MKHYAGLDVSLKETSICILDEAGKICREIRVASHPEDLLRRRCHIKQVKGVFGSSAPHSASR